MHSSLVHIEQNKKKPSKIYKFTNIEIVPTTFSDHNAIKLEISHRKKKRKTSSPWILNKKTAKREQKGNQENN